VVWMSVTPFRTVVTCKGRSVVKAMGSPLVIERASEVGTDTGRVDGITDGSGVTTAETAEPTPPRALITPGTRAVADGSTDGSTDGRADAAPVNIPTPQMVEPELSVPRLTGDSTRGAAAVAEEARALPTLLAAPATPVTAPPTPPRSPAELEAGAGARSRPATAPGTTVVPVMTLNMVQVFEVS
jgi:hypothetical protein